MSRGNQSEVINGVLEATVVAGMVATIIIAPNALTIVGKKFRKTIRSDESKDLRKVITYMKAKKYVQVDNLPDGAQTITITEQGKTQFEKREFDKLHIPKPRNWDQKWRLVLFDIPESHKVARNALNMKLRELGFKKLQKSAWIHPYPCETEIELVKDTYAVNQYVSLLEVTKVDNHNELLKKFANIF